MEENENVLDENEKKQEQEPKKIEIVTGDGDLAISPVYEHLEVEKPKPKENRTIVVPEVKDNIVREDDTKKNEEAD